MTKRNTRRALLMSALSLVLCMSMLIGSTFAWFTDSVTSSGNKIQSGTLKLDLELLDKESGNWNSIKEDETALFNYNKWEPGYTETKVLKVENEGSLALKWYAKFVSTAEVTKLADAIDVYVRAYGVLDDADAASVAYPSDRNLDGYTKVGTLAEFINTIETTTYGSLEAGESAYLGLALKMQEEAGNVYQGLDLAGAFDIQILATQLDYESDSFSDDYDANLDAMTSGVSRVLSDGSTAFYYSDESGYGGRVRLTALPENHGSEYVVPAEVNDLGGVLVGATLDKLTITENVKYAYKSLQGANIGEVIVKEGATVIPNRMFYRANIDSVVIPSTVTVVEQNAFAETAGVTELVIPASVQTVEEAAFQHMKNLTTVTFEGNTAIQGYAFRGCKELRTVYLKGDDTTFIVSTLNGRDNCWFCNGESNNPNTSNITFYVQNDTVATRVKTAMGAEASNTPVIIWNPTDVYATSAAELKSALASGATEINIVGAITLTEGLSASNVTLIGNGDGAAINFAGHNIAGSGEITYKNLKLSTVSLPQTPENGERYGWYGGIDYKGHSVANYEGCTISGVFTTYSETVNVTGCTFNPYIQDGEEFYHIFVYGSKQVDVTGSTFYYQDRAIKVYNEGGVKDVVLNVSDSKFFAANGASVNKALVNVDSSYMNSVELNISNITVDSALSGVQTYSGSKVTATIN